MTTNERGSARDPLAAVPVVAAGVCVQARAGAGLVVVLVERPRGAIASFLERRFAFRRERRFELDAVGARFFLEIDGCQSLDAIRRTLVRDCGIDASAARDAVVAFTAALMRRGLIALSVETEAPGERHV